MIAASAKAGDLVFIRIRKAGSAAEAVMGMLPAPARRTEVCGNPMVSLRSRLPKAG